MLEMLKNGSGIHIKKKNRGSFTKWCGGNVTDECIRRGKNSPNPKIRRKATFADNARHFKHKSGGILKAENGMKSKRAIKAGDLARMHLQKSKAPDWDSLDYGYNEMGKNGLSHPERVAIMGNTIQENAGSPKGHGIIQWVKNVPQGRDAQWKSVIDSVIDQANVYDRKTDSMLNWWGKYKNMNGRKAQELFRSPHTDIPGKTRIYSESYIRPGTPEINKRILYAQQLDSIYNPNIKDNIVYYKKGGKAFVPGISITDSNPNAYKYIKKHYKLKGQYGTKLNFFQKAGNFLNSDTGKTIVGTIGQLYSGIQNNINNSKLMDELQKWKESYINSAQPEDFSEQIMREEQQIKESNPDYNSSPIAIKFRENQLQQENLKLNKEKHAQEADQYITNFILSRQNNNQSKSNIGDLLTQGLGYIGNYLGKNSNDTSSKLFTNTSGYSPISISSSVTAPSADSILQKI